MSRSATLRRIERLEADLAVSKNTWQCPDVWEDFARLCEVRSGSKIVKFNPYGYQVHVVQALEHHSIVVAKTRQLGITETLAIWALWRAILDPGFMGLFLSKTQKDTSAIARRVKRSIEGLDGAVKLRTDNVCDLEIVGGGRLLFANSSRNGARGVESVSFALLDESAFVEGIDEIYTGLAPALSSGGDGARVAIVSTPNGQNGWFWGQLTRNNGDVDLLAGITETRAFGFKQWVDDAGWGKLLIHWKAHPIHSQNPDYLNEIREKYNMSERAIAQEFDLNFTESSSAVFSAALVQSAIASHKRATRPSHGRHYAGVDSCGSGEDYAVCCILRLDGDALEVVQWYRQRNGTTDLHLYKIGQLLGQWRPHTVAVEKNSMGQVWLEALQREHRSLEFEGVTTSQTSKAVMIDRLVMLLESGKIRIPSDCPLIEELLSFQRNGNVLEAASGKHDDFVMALAVAVSVSPLGSKSELVGCGFVVGTKRLY